MGRSLRETLERYRSIEASLADPETTQNPARLKELLKERGTLERSARLYEEFLKVRTQIGEARQLQEDPEVAELATEELAELEVRRDGLVRQLADEMGTDEADRSKSVIVEVRPGVGGDEAALFASDLVEMYRRFAESHRFKLEMLELQATELGGTREAIFSISGKDVYRLLKFESGGHRVQRVPATESQGRVHTSSATVAVLPEIEEVEIDIKQEDLRIDKMRAGGPGGQKVNKTESAIRVTHIPTGVVVKCQDEKSQHKNLARAMRILKTRLYDQLRQERDRERARERKSQIGSGDRSERIRTYNFPQDRLTDHRLGTNLHGLPDVMLGKLDPLIEQLRAQEREERLAELDLVELEDGE
ncbi:MAG: peptide chain release factor 1 [Planctomycetota bacterium]|nr:peptide chain release factor 1 [Planctomycetota bacterium]